MIRLNAPLNIFSLLKEGYNFPHNEIHRKHLRTLMTPILSMYDHLDRNIIVLLETQ